MRQPSRCSWSGSRGGRCACQPPSSQEPERVVGSARGSCSGIEIGRLAIGPRRSAHAIVARDRGPRRSSLVTKARRRREVAGRATRARPRGAGAMVAADHLGLRGAADDRVRRWRRARRWLGCRAEDFAARPQLESRVVKELLNWPLRRGEAQRPVPRQARPRQRRGSPRPSPTPPVSPATRHCASPPPRCSRTSTLPRLTTPSSERSGATTPARPGLPWHPARRPAPPDPAARRGKADTRWPRSEGGPGDRGLGQAKDHLVGALELEVRCRRTGQALMRELTGRLAAALDGEIERDRASCAAASATTITTIRRAAPVDRQRRQGHQWT